MGQIMHGKIIALTSLGFQVIITNIGATGVPKHTGKYCVADGSCTNTSYSNGMLRQKWVRFVQRLTQSRFKPKALSALCSTHFDPGVNSKVITSVLPCNCQVYM